MLAREGSSTRIVGGESQSSRLLHRFKFLVELLGKLVLAALVGDLLYPGAVSLPPIKTVFGSLSMVLSVGPAKSTLKYDP